MTGIPLTPHGLKSVENAGYEDNESFFFKNHVKVGKKPCILVQDGPNFKDWVTNKPWRWFRGAGLLALEPPVLDGGQAEA